MTHPNPPVEHRQAALRELAHRLFAVDWVAPITPDEIDRLHALMPPRQRQESLTDWLDRGLRPVRPPAETGTRAPVLRFRPRPSRPVRLVAESLAWAAAGPSPATPPLPERLEIGDKCFFAAFRLEGDMVLVSLQALGRTLLELRGKAVVVTGPEGISQTLAELTLGPRGEGHFRCPDNAEVRALLLAIKVWRLDEAE